MDILHMFGNGYREIEQWYRCLISNKFEFFLLYLSTYLICSGDPPDVAFVMAQAASLRVLKSARPRMSINTGKILASITACKNKMWTLCKLIKVSNAIRTYFICFSQSLNGFNHHCTLNI